jgi:hypothetical protein
VYKKDETPLILRSESGCVLIVPKVEAAHVCNAQFFQLGCMAVVSKFTFEGGIVLLSGSYGRRRFP